MTRATTFVGVVLVAALAWGGELPLEADR